MKSMQKYYLYDNKPLTKNLLSLQQLWELFQQLFISLSKRKSEDERLNPFIILFKHENKQI